MTLKPDTTLSREAYLFGRSLHKKTPALSGGSRIKNNGLLKRGRYVLFPFNSMYSEIRNRTSRYSIPPTI